MATTRISSKTTNRYGGKKQQVEFFMPMIRVKFFDKIRIVIADVKLPTRQRLTDSPFSSSCVLVPCPTSGYREKSTRLWFIRHRLRVKITHGKPSF